MKQDTDIESHGKFLKVHVWQIAVACLLCVSVYLWLLFHPRTVATDAGQQGGSEKQVIRMETKQPASSQPRVLTPALPGSGVRVLSSGKFRARYSARVERREVESVLHTLEDARVDVEHRTDSAAIQAMDPPQLDVLIHDTTADFVTATGQPWWAAAVAHDNVIELQPLEILRSRGVLNQTLRHEYAHTVIEMLSHGRAPRWLEEGLAAHVAGEGAMLSSHDEAERLSIEELERRLTQATSAEEMRVLYAAAYREVASLIRSEGEASVWQRVSQS